VLAFVWKQSADDWAITAELLEGLMERPRAGHQYLSDSAADDPLIAVSKGEFGDSN